MKENIILKIEEILKENEIEIYGFCKVKSFNEINENIVFPEPLKYLRNEAYNDLRIYLPWAKSLIVVAIPYNTTTINSLSILKNKDRVWISRYAFIEDYHKILRKKLKPLKDFLLKSGFKAKICVDSFPLRERSYAVLAKIGFIGRNGLLITEKYGSYVFLGEIITDLELQYEEKENTSFEFNKCKMCLKCVKACPNEALKGEGSIELSKCIPVYNVEWKGEFPENSPPFHKNLFGCDICQEVCPFNNQKPINVTKEFIIIEDLFAPSIENLLKMDRKRLEDLIQKTPLKRKKVEGILKNLEKILKET